MDGRVVDDDDDDDGDGDGEDVSNTGSAMSTGREDIFLGSENSKGRRSR